MSRCMFCLRLSHINSLNQHTLNCDANKWKTNKSLLTNTSGIRQWVNKREEGEWEKKENRYASLRTCFFPYVFVVSVNKALNLFFFSLSFSKEVFLLTRERWTKQKPQVEKLKIYICLLSWRQINKSSRVHFRPENKVTIQKHSELRRIEQCSAGCWYRWTRSQWLYMCGCVCICVCVSLCIFVGVAGCFFFVILFIVRHFVLLNVWKVLPYGGELNNKIV